ncbi:MAG: Holliday junction branch migration protein RuvA [Paramuribaculum sp.]|nr:Holliday junction branch migration protein RuvA [Paramuribaculum sp.]
MLEYVRGALAELTPTYAVIDCNGVGYLLNISLSTYTALQAAKEAKLLVHEAIREDAWQLYGFAEERERNLFRSLIGVSGVGAGTARVILSSLAPPELEKAIIAGDHTKLKNVKGIGAKTAQRIIVDLRDKIKPGSDAFISQPTVSSETFEEALAALLMLGFPKPAVQKALKKIFDADPAVKVESAVKQALAMM